MKARLPPMGGGGAQETRNQSSAVVSFSASVRSPQPESWQAEIEVDDFGQVYFVTDGDPATAVVVRAGGPDSGPFDVVVFPNDQPDWVHTLRGVAALIGYANFDHAAITGEPIRLHHNPKKWIEAGGDGIAIVDSFLAFSLLRGLACVICDDREQATQIHERLRNYAPPLPAIRFLRRVAA